MSDTAIILMIVFALITILTSLVLQGIATSALDNKDYAKELKGMRMKLIH
ncbi:unnamed protein product [marine sediment metagenome]|uniref:Uncharacterized protein n=1 Tax=marine sediment metagenome TaxID=412755 RepID=X1DEP0_9ZZZZ